MKHIIFGPPGTGKTTRLLGIMSDLFEQGYEPEEIAFVSFTRKAANEAKDRAIEKFGFNEKRFKWFRTLHSIAYEKLFLSKDLVMQRKNYTELGDMLNIKFTGRFNMDDGVYAGTEEGDKILFIDNYARNRCMSLEQAWRAIGDNDTSWLKLRQFKSLLEEYKREYSMFDYTDMIELFEKESEKLDIRVAIIDEAQDLSTLQWNMVDHICQECEKVYIAGDDDQAIYKWSGADVERFIDQDGSREVLDKSYRLPSSIHKFANSISKKIGNRVSKNWTHRGDSGELNFVAGIENIDIQETEGSWMILVRNNFIAKRYSEFLRTVGLPYTVKSQNSIKDAHLLAMVNWEHLRKGNVIDLPAAKGIYKYLQADTGVLRGYKQLKHAAEKMYDIKELKSNWGLLTEAPWYEALAGIPETDRNYYRQILRAGIRLQEPPRIAINTIHSVKGGEADHIIVAPDMAYNTWQTARVSPGDEHRVWYVAVTRARQAAYMLAPRTRFFYEY